ncbi:hypothetical protein [Oceanobacillus sp. CFH 90083]|uniref:hypothetical protein n=1 Tax=Oceanobacillus sp. CFH 90083 TaxID=2592336 RepID=UPI00128D7F9D|nr:hypothetical protein [Oceanobacillus sp. CFH 90083]
MKKKQSFLAKLIFSIIFVIPLLSFLSAENLYVCYIGLIIWVPLCIFVIQPWIIADFKTDKENLVFAH